MTELDRPTTAATRSTTPKRRTLFYELRGPGAALSPAPDGGRGFRALSPGWLAGLFWALVIVQVLPVWCFRWIPTTDGPSHVYNALLLGQYVRADHAAWRAFFALNLRPFPNWFAPAALTGLTWVMPPLVAEKLLLSLYLVLLPVSARYALASIDRRSTWLALLVVPLTANFYLHEGLWNYCFSIAFFFFVIGYWLRYGRHLSTHRMLTLCALGGLLYFTHMIGLIMADVFIVGMIALRGDWRPRSAGFKGALRSVAAAAPWILLTLGFMLAGHSGRMVIAAARHPKPWSHRLRYVLSWMKSFRSDELPLAGVELALVIALFVWLLSRRGAMARRGDLTRSGRVYASRFDGLIAIAGVYLLIFLIAPGAAAGGSMIIVRLACFPLFALILWMAAQFSGPVVSATSERRLQYTVAGISGLLTLSLVASHTLSYARLNPYLQEFADIEMHIPAGATMLPIYISDGEDLDARGSRLSFGASPLVAAADYTAAQRGIVNLDNYEAGVDYFPLQYRPGLDPYQEIFDKQMDFVGYAQRTGKPVDYVLIWTGGVDRDDAMTRAVWAQLATHYHPIYTSAYSGYGRLYERNKSTASTARTDERGQ